MPNAKHLILAVAVFAGTIGASAAAHAQPAAGALKIAVFEPSLIYAQSNAAKRAGDQLLAKQQQAKTKIDALSKSFDDKQKALSSQQALLSPDKLKSQQDDLRKDYVNVRTQATKISADFEKDQFDARKAIADVMRTAVDDLAKEKGYDLVLPKGLAFYVAPGVADVSQEVLTRVNAKLK